MAEPPSGPPHRGPTNAIVVSFAHAFIEEITGLSNVSQILCNTCQIHLFVFLHLSVKAVPNCCKMFLNAYSELWYLTHCGLLTEFADQHRPWTTL